MEERVDVDDIQTFVGRNAEYYVSRWASFLKGGTGSAGFNWAAFFLVIWWLCYRKMYAVAAIVVGVIFLETFLEELIFVGGLGMPETPRIVDFLVGISIGAICGLFGNRWYFRHAVKVIRDVHFKEREPEARKTALIKRGGTSWVRPVLATVLVLGAGIVVYELVLVLLYPEIGV